MNIQLHEKSWEKFVISFLLQYENLLCACFHSPPESELTNSPKMINARLAVVRQHITARLAVTFPHCKNNKKLIIVTFFTHHIIRNSPKYDPSRF